jgi:5-methyltetrahydrofolate--homocysteine methyltransferase
VSSLLNRISAGEVLLCDGAMGTMLIERGLKLGECPEAWNLSHPDRLVEIARLYTQAGADIVETNTFGGSPLKLAQYELDARTEAVTQSAVRAAREGADGKALVALSCGPTGKLLKPFGDTEPEEIRASLERQIGAAVGEKIGLTAAGADLIGSNCGNGIDNMVQVAREFRRHSKLPLAIQANAGLPRLEGNRAVYSETPDLMAGRIEALVKAGVALLGGCCGTTPEHIAAFRREIDRLGRH